jgi:hypothetical protein
VKVKRSTLKRRCDRLWSLIIRASNRGTCKLAGRDNVRCGGVLQAAHCFGRGYSGVRYELWNGWPLCAGHHVYYTHKPELWIWRLEDEWGEAAYSERFALATARPGPGGSEACGLRADRGGVARGGEAGGGCVRLAVVEAARERA